MEESNRTPMRYQGLWGKRILYFLLSCLAVFALHCRFEIFGGGFPDSDLLNGLNKLYDAFSGPEFVDLLVLAAIYKMLWFADEKCEQAGIGTLIFSFGLSVLLVAAISFKKFNSTAFLRANSFQLFISCICIAGFWVMIYNLIRCLYALFPGEGFGIMETKAGKGKSFLEKYFFPVGFFVIFLGWLPWILMNYPGSGCPDSVLQLKEFFGEEPWAAGHPPLSTCIMGGLVALGRWLADANFGCFLYCLLQTCVGAWVFSLSMKKLRDIGVGVGWCMAGIVFFAFTPFWGTYAQWVEKDLLYAEAALLQTICMMEILVKKQCDKRDTALLFISTLAAVFLRNNGIHAVLPALLLLAIWLRGVSRRRVGLVMLVTLIAYEGTMRVLYPALDMGGIPVSESLSIPFQQTARYVCEHGNEVTEQEREVLEKTFGYENLFGYNPVISDPVKIRYRGAELGEYFKVWFGMFWKHPGTYVSAFVNQAYGYLAPVEPNIEAWIQEEYDYDYMRELGLYHVFDIKLAYVLAQIWHLSMRLPLVKYLCMPGLYTWIVMILALLLLKRRRYAALILFVPGFMNILVCLASPLANAIRYELPTVASVPLLLGWAYSWLARREG